MFDVHDVGFAAIGGALVGLGALLLMATHGRIAGISGILGDWLRAPREGWRAAFIVGLLAGGGALVALSPAAFANTGSPGLVVLALAGGLVGFGARLGSGCTSGHGVCGLSRVSPRSFAAVLTFVVVAVVTARLVQL